MNYFQSSHFAFPTFSFGAQGKNLISAFQPEYVARLLLLLFSGSVERIQQQKYAQIYNSTVYIIIFVFVPVLYWVVFRAQGENQISAFQPEYVAELSHML